MQKARWMEEVAMFWALGLMAVAFVLAFGQLMRGQVLLNKH